MEKKRLKTYSLDQIKDELIGVEGTPERQSYEQELKKELKRGVKKQGLDGEKNN